MDTVNPLDVRITTASEPQLADTRTRQDQNASLLLRLPDEILLNILLRHQDYLFEQGCVKNWARMMLVCRHFRRLGISSPALWSRLQLPTHCMAHGIRLHKDRGACRPYTVHLSIGPFTPGTLRRICDPILSLAPRTNILEFEVLFDSGNLGEGSMYHEITSSKWDNLETLWIKDSTAKEAAVIPITPTLLNGACPSLTSLTFGHRFRYHWSYVGLPVLPNLKSLDIQWMSMTAPITRLREDLSHCKSLEKLCIQFATESEVAGFSDAELERMTPLSLPYLRELELQSCKHAIGYLMAVLPLPSNVLSIEAGTSDIVPFINKRLREFFALDKTEVSAALGEAGPQVTDGSVSLTTDGDDFDDSGTLLSAIISMWSCGIGNTGGRPGRVLDCTTIGGPEDMSVFVRHASQVDLELGGPASAAATVLALIEDAQPSLGHLRLHYWHPEGWGSPEWSQALENYLRKRRDAACILACLQLNLSWVNMDLGHFGDTLRKWLGDGLLGEVLCCNLQLKWTLKSVRDLDHWLQEDVPLLASSAITT